MEPFVGMARPSLATKPSETQMQVGQMLDQMLLNEVSLTRLRDVQAENAAREFPREALGHRTWIAIGRLEIQQDTLRRKILLSVKS
jgi:hypothetical protein